MARTLGVMLTFAAAWIFLILWILSPIDPVPDMVPLFGWMDDVLAFAGTSIGTGFAIWRLTHQPVLVEKKPDKPVYEPVEPGELRRW